MGHCLGDNGTHPVVPDRSVTIFQVRYVSTCLAIYSPASRRPVKRVKTTQTRLTPRLTVPRVNPRVELKTVYRVLGLSTLLRILRRLFVWSRRRR